MFRQIIIHLQPGKPAFVIEVKFRRECCRVGKRGGIDMHGAGIMAGFETKGRATCAAKITPYAWRAFKGVRSCAPPFEILERHADPGNDRCRTVPATVVAMAITAPARFSLELPAGFPAKAMPSCCHDGLLQSVRTGGSVCWSIYAVKDEISPGARYNRNSNDFSHLIAFFQFVISEK